MKKTFCFTLAEVLVTLSILGVVAAIVIPNVINKISDRVAITQLKKAVSAFNEAFQKAVIIEGDPVKWDSSGDIWSSRRVSLLAPYFNVKKICLKDPFSYATYTLTCSGYPTIEGTESYVFRNLNNTRKAQSVFASFITKDGILYMPINNSLKDKGFVHPDFQSEKYLFSLLIDINGSKKPNRFGYDVFFFPVTDKGILIKDNISSLTYDNYYGVLHKANCKYKETRYNPGYSCGNYVIRHNNMDYKYRDVSSEW